MERYGSFKVDHKELKPGIYLSRVKMVGSDFIVTLDIRVREPYVDKPLTVMEAHSVEHIMATNLEKDDNKVYFGPMGCHVRGTKVIMADGTLRNVEDIKIGDCLMGVNSEPREVLNLVRGRDELFRIKQKHGDSYIVNADHILSLKYSKGERRYGCGKGDVINISVRDFVQKSESFKRLFKGYKEGYEGIEMEYEIPPYILGLWLGDGVRCKPCLCVNNSEEEIAEAWRSYGASLGMHCNIEEDKGASRRYWLHHERDSYRPNPFMVAICSLGLYKNKHIPEKYFCGSIRQRENLLCGLINSDGWCSSRGFKNKESVCYGTVLPELAKDVKRLAISLGFNANIVETKDFSTMSVRGSSCITRPYYHVIIVGNVNRLALWMNKKRPVERDTNRDCLLSSITVEPLNEVGDYFGFNLDGNMLYHLEDGTITHNCMTGFYYVYKVGQNDPDKVAGSLVKAATWDVSEGVPFATEYECGNCHSLAFREKDLRKVKRDMDIIKRLAVDVYTNARFDTYPML